MDERIAKINAAVALDVAMQLEKKEDLDPIVQLRFIWKELLEKSPELQDNYITIVWTLAKEIPPESNVWARARALDKVKIVEEKRPGIMGWLPTQESLVNMLRDATYNLWKLDQEKKDKK